MKGKKLNLSELAVNSFVTGLDKSNGQQTVKGGNYAIKKKPVYSVIVTMDAYCRETGPQNCLVWTGHAVESVCCNDTHC